MFTDPLLLLPCGLGSHTVLFPAESTQKKNTKKRGGHGGFAERERPRFHQAICFYRRVTGHENVDFIFTDVIASQDKQSLHDIL